MSRYGGNPYDDSSDDDFPMMRGSSMKSSKHSRRSMTSSPINRVPGSDTCTFETMEDVAAFQLMKFERKTVVSKDRSKMTSASKP